MPCCFQQEGMIDRGQLARFAPADFEYDFERDELAAHHVSFDTRLARASCRVSCPSSVPRAVASYSSVEDWLRRVIQERVELEEAAFVGIKRSLAGGRKSITAAGSYFRWADDRPMGCSTVCHHGWRPCGTTWFQGAAPNNLSYRMSVVCGCTQTTGQA